MRKLPPRLIGIFLLVVFGACVRKELPEPVVTAPDFSVHGQLDGEPFRMVAGQDGYFADASVEQDAFGVYHFSSEIRKYNCGECPGRFTIRLSSHEIYEPGQSPQTIQAIVEQSYDFQLTPAESNYMTFQFFAPPGFNNTYYWSFGDDEHSSDQNPQHTYTTPGVKEVTLSMFGFGGCSGTSSQTIYAGSNQVCAVPFFISEMGINTIELSIPDELPNGLELVSWTVDNNSNLPLSPELEIEFEWGFSHNVCAEYFNTVSGCSGSYCVHLFGPSQQPCSTLMHSQWVAQSPDLGSAEIEYEREDGSLFTSVFSLNNSPDNFFEVTEIADYSLMLDGHITKRIHVNFSTSLVNVAGLDSTSKLENISADMLFVLPQ